MVIVLVAGIAFMPSEQVLADAITSPAMKVVNLDPRYANVGAFTFKVDRDVHIHGCEARGYIVRSKGQLGNEPEDIQWLNRVYALVMSAYISGKSIKARTTDSDGCAEWGYHAVQNVWFAE